MEVPNRSEVEHQFTWNVDNIFSSKEERQAEYGAVLVDLKDVRALSEKMVTSPSGLVDVLDGIMTIKQRTTKVFLYAYLIWSVDTTNQSAGERVGQVQGLKGRLESAISFLEPGPLAHGHDRLLECIGDNYE